MRKRNRFAIAFLLCLCALFGWQGAEAAEVAADSVSTATISHPRGKLSGFKYWRHVGGNKFRGNNELAWRQHGLDKIEIAEMRLLVDQKFEWATFSNGQEFHKISFGKNEIWKETIADWGENKAYAARLYRLSSGKTIAQILWCKNWVTPELVPMTRDMAGLEAIIKAVPDETPESVPAPKEEPRAGYSQIDAEFNGGGYGYRGHGSHGRGNYMDGSILFDAGEGYRVGLGFFAAGNSGETNNDSYRWKTPWTIGPQLAIMRDTGSQGFISKSRLLFGSSHEEYSTDGWYSQRQSGNMFGQYFEYYSRPNANFKWGAVGELWVPFGQQVTGSTDRYAEIKDLGSWYLGIYGQQWLSPDWAIRAKPGLFHTNIDRVTSAKFELTARYREMLYAGPDLSVNLANGAMTWGAVIGIELRGTVRKAWQNANGKVKYVGTVKTYGENHSENGNKPVDFGVSTD